MKDEYSFNEEINYFGWIKNLSDELERDICSKCKGKRVLLTLTGGMDNRVILAILLRNNIKFDALVVYLRHKQRKYLH